MSSSGKSAQAGLLVMPWFPYPCSEVSTHMVRSIDNYSVFDPNEGVPLQEIARLSMRATSLLVRNKNNPLLRTGFVNVIGAIEMLAGMEYHHDNIMRLCSGLATGKIRDEQGVNHEAVAYINRMGQFYYFAISDFVKMVVGNADTLIPTIVKFKVFRMKHAAHRSIDAPRKETDDLKWSHARSLATFDGRFMKLKPGAMFNFPKKIKRAGRSWNKFQREQWKHVYIVFQIFDDEVNAHVDLTIETDHLSIAAEAYTLLEKIIMHEGDHVPSALRASATDHIANS
jgi:hypothetical protein